MYPRITTLIAASLILGSEVDAWDWWWSSPPAPPMTIQEEIPVAEPLPPVELSPASIQTFWKLTTGGNWDSAGSWTGGVPPNGQDDLAYIGATLTQSGAIITASAPSSFTIGTLDLEA